MTIPNSYDLLQAVIEATPDAIFVKDLDGRYVLVNESAARFLGRPQEAIIGKRDLELYHEETARRFIDEDRQVLEAGQPQAFEGVAVGPDGLQAYLVTKGPYCDPAGRVLGLFGISHDVTELRRARETLERTREELFRAQKMEAVGQLTGGLAHDFNNILSVILGNIELLRMRLTNDADAEELIETVHRAAIHGRDLTGDLLAFARQRQLNPQPVDVNGVAEGMVRLLGRTLGAPIRVTTVPTRDNCVAFVDQAALEAALLNVALNARDAMPDGGTLTIRTSRVVVTEAPATDEDLQPRVYVVLSLEDTGSGMPPDVVARAFEPFFTTKTGRGGTGLGLSMVYGFARQSGGTVTISSSPGRGTTVRMFFPESIDAPASATAGDPSSEAAAAVARKILVVEDEADVRTTVRRQLQSLGHEVLVAEAATEALLLLTGPGAPDVLLTDVVLESGMNGIELGAAARKARPGLPVIFMSGYTAVPEAQQSIRELGAPLLSKPSTLSQLRRAVNAVCAGR